MKNIFHSYFTKAFSFVIDLIFLCSFYIYIFAKKLWIKYARRNSVVRSEYNLETSLDVVPENNIDTGDDPIRNLDLDWEHVITDFKGKRINLHRHVLDTINKKNHLKKIIALYLSIITHFIIIYLIVFNFFIKSPSFVESPADSFNTTESDIYWYHAKLSLIKYPTYSDLLQSYGDVINKKCIPLKERDILQNRLSESHGTPDLTFLYHSMCHLAIDQTMHTNEPAVITPKILNITDFRSENYDIPLHLFSANFTTIPELDIPNICVMAIAMPPDNNNPNDHDISSFSFEKILHEDLPPGLFIHSSKLYHNNNSAYFDVNPIMKTNTSSIWSSTLSPGRCSILINPYIYLSSDTSSYSIIYTSSLIEEETFFETSIKNFTLSYYDTTNLHNHINPSSANLKINIQTVWNIMSSAVPFVPIQNK